jgi:hypothetical protein
MKRIASTRRSGHRAFPAPFSSTGILKGTTKRIPVRDRNAFIAFAEVLK